MNDNFDAWLESLGTEKDAVLSSKKLIDDITIVWGQGAIDSIRKVMRKEGLFASGSLYQEIEPWKIKETADGIKVYLEMLEYWEQVDRGREKGKKLTTQELKSLSDWVQIKGLPSKFKMPLKSVVFLISRSIYKKGTIKRYGYKGSNFIEMAMTDKIMKDLELRIATSTESILMSTLKKS